MLDYDAGTMAEIRTAQQEILKLLSNGPKRSDSIFKLSEKYDPVTNREILNSLLIYREALDDLEENRKIASSWETINTKCVLSYSLIQ